MGRDVHKMNKIKTVIWIESVILILLLILGLLQLTEIGSFWQLNFESLANIFITATLGVIGFYITINIIENNTSKRRKLEFMENQLEKLANLLDSDTIKLAIDQEGEYPAFEDFLSLTQKMRDIISNVEHFIAIIENGKEQFSNLISNFQEYNQVSNYYCAEAIKKGYKITNQRREDMNQNISKILIELYEAY